MVKIGVNTESDGDIFNQFMVLERFSAKNKIKTYIQ